MNCLVFLFKPVFDINVKQTFDFFSIPFKTSNNRKSSLLLRVYALILLRKLNTMSLTSSTIGRKVAMALSGLFLVVFLTNTSPSILSSVFSENTFNEISHFMGNNPLVQFYFSPF